MGAGAVVSPSEGKKYPGRFTTRVLVTCIVAAFGGLIFGYDLGISGGVTSMDNFLKKFFPWVYLKQSNQAVSTNQYCKFDSQLLTLFTSSLYLAALVACVVASYLTKKFGRKMTMLSGGILFMGGALLNFFAENIGMLIIGRVLLGLGIGFATQSVPLYLSETAPSNYRGALNIMFQLFITVGILAAGLTNFILDRYVKGDLAWRLALGGAAIPGLMITVGSLFLPDTPNSLIDRGQKEEAKAQLVKIRGVDNVDEEFNDLVNASEASKLITNPWRTLMTRKYRPHLVMAVFLPALQQLTGVNVVTFYAPVLFKTLGFGSSASLASALITNGVNMMATFVSIAIVDKVGRVKIFLEGGIQMCITQFIIGTLLRYTFGVDGNAGAISPFFAWLLVILICIYVAGFAWSWGPLAWLVTSEIFPLEVRSAAQSINVSVNMIFTFAIAQAFTALLCLFRFTLFYVFAVFLGLMTLFIFKFLPETKEVPIEEMAIVWEKHSYWRKFVLPPDEGIV